MLVRLDNGETVVVSYSTAETLDRIHFIDLALHKLQWPGTNKEDVIASLDDPAAFVGDRIIFEKSEDGEMKNVKLLVSQGDSRIGHASVKVEETSRVAI
ncbi:MAG: hypothetical protein KGJ35_02395 [Patescibacteria group bacterium]|nr:hypothetical protein [Patescibacteria group bacterium]